MNRLSVIIITYNEEANIKECLESLKWADEIIVVDSNSKDKTVEIAKKYSSSIYNAGSASGKLSYAQKRNFGFDKAAGEWLLWIDADERVTENLKNEIIEVINRADPDSPAYLIKRKSFFINKFIKHCGWYPDYTLRLFKKSSGIRFNEPRVHEKIIYEGKIKKLKSEIIHYTDLTFEHYMNKLNSYTSSSAADLFEQKSKASIIDIIFRPAFTFIKMYFLKLGILDGYTGLVLCTLSSTHVLVKYSKLYFLNLKS